MSSHRQRLAAKRLRKRRERERRLAWLRHMAVEYADLIVRAPGYHFVTTL